MGVLAVVGLLLVMRGVGAGGGGGSASPSRIDPGSEVRRGGDSGRDSGRGGSTQRRFRPGGERAQVKRSPKAYVSCVEQATNTAALEKCQPLLP